MANRERLLKTLTDLIRIDSPTGEEDQIDAEISSRLEALGFHIHHDSFQEPYRHRPRDRRPGLAVCPHGHRGTRQRY